jgi:hypothetical protein
LDSGEQELVVRHSLPANRMTTPLVLGQFVKQFEARSAKPEKEGATVNQPIHSAKATGPVETMRGRRIPLMRLPVSERCKACEEQRVQCAPRLDVMQRKEIDNCGKDT